MFLPEIITTPSSSCFGKHQITQQINERKLKVLVQCCWNPVWKSIKWNLTQAHKGSGFTTGHLSDCGPTSSC